MPYAPRTPCRWHPCPALVPRGESYCGAHAIAKDHGWWDEERTFGDCIALVHSELSEALEAYRMYGLEKFYSVDDDFIVPDDYEGLGLKKLEGVGSELADVVIRVADMAEYYGVNNSQSESAQPASGVFMVAL